MRETTPTVHLVARPSLDLDGLRTYLEAVGGATWLDRRLHEAGGRPNAGELLVEFAGRACYRSWEPGLNPNVTRVRSDQQEYFENLLRSAHGSVLEHASYTFALRDVSRVFTHELVRHRAGSAFSQESLRYVRLTEIGFRVPPALEPVRDRVAWDDAFVDALCEPPQSFTYGGVLSHILSFGAVRREMLASVLDELGATVPAGDPILWEQRLPR